MASVATRELITLADLLDDLGVGAERVRLRPPPGTATEDDLLAIHHREKRLCELVDGVLVEKTMGYAESALAMYLGSILAEFVRTKKLGIVSGESGMMRLMPRLVRIPDVAFASWDRVPGRRMPTEPIPDLVPDLAVEVLSASNTDKEMTRKCTEYFDAGVTVVWLVDPRSRSVEVHAGPDTWTELKENQELDGGSVLPGFRLSLSQLFELLDEQGPA